MANGRVRQVPRLCLLGDEVGADVGIGMRREWPPLHLLGVYLQECWLLGLPSETYRPFHPYRPYSR